MEGSPSPASSADAVPAGGDDSRESTPAGSLPPNTIGGTAGRPSTLHCRARFRSKRGRPPRKDHAHYFQGCCRGTRALAQESTDSGLSAFTDLSFEDVRTDKQRVRSHEDALEHSGAACMFNRTVISLAATTCCHAPHRSSLQWAEADMSELV